jgi:hypothetical protein
MKTDRTVFVGFTFRDLEHHRWALIEALHDLAWLRVMESRGAAPGNAVENCLRWVQASDVYVGILGMSYGSRDPRSGESFTEIEYDEAMRIKLPCLLYLIDEDRHPLLASSVDRGKDAEDLVRFKAKVSSANHRGLFRSPEHLQYQVTRDIIALFDDLGWWVPQKDAPATGQSHPQDIQWRIDLCAWGSPQGVLDLSHGSNEAESDVADIAASILVSRFARGDFANLRGIITLRPEIRNALRSFLVVRDIDETTLAENIRNARDALNVRLLIDVAGLARTKRCVEAVCDQVLHRGPRWDGELRALGYEMRSFLDVSVEALGRMPLPCEPVIADYIERARAIKQWRARDTFEKALRQIRGRSLETS